MKEADKEQADSVTRFLDIRGILRERGITPPETKFNWGGELKGFFLSTDVPPESPFGEFVRMRAVEKNVADEVGEYTRRKLARNPEPPDSVIAEIREKGKHLNDIREVRKALGEEIFGEKSEEYTKHVDEVLYKYPGTMSQERKKRAAAREQLINDITVNFPLTMYPKKS